MAVMAVVVPLPSESGEGTAGNFEGALTTSSPATIMEGTRLSLPSPLFSSMKERWQSSSPCGAAAMGRTTPSIEGACQRHRCRCRCRVDGRTGFLTTRRKRRTTTKMVMKTIVCSRSPTTTAVTAAQEQQYGRGRCNYRGDDVDIKVGGMSAFRPRWLPGTAMGRGRG